MSTHPIWNDDDIADSMSDSPNSITATPDGGSPVSAPCWFSDSDELKQESPGGAGVLMRLTTVHVQTSLFKFLDSGAACEVDGVPYTVWKRAEEVGGTTVLMLRAAA